MLEVIQMGKGVSARHLPLPRTPSAWLPRASPEGPRELFIPGSRLRAPPASPELLGTLPLPTLFLSGHLDCHLLERQEWVLYLRPCVHSRCSVNTYLGEAEKALRNASQGVVSNRQACCSARAPRLPWPPARTVPGRDRPSRAQRAVAGAPACPPPFPPPLGGRFKSQAGGSGG